MSPRTERAEQIAELIRAALAAADIDDAPVTVNGLDVPQGAPNGAVVILPPRMTFPTYHQTEVTWELCVTAGPADNHIVAWDRIDSIVAAIAPGLDVTVAEPASFAPNVGPNLSAYLLTYTDPE